ncbi:Mono- and diacylglycerol lipase [Escovopsis weberi]|uniref:Mono-and diacylglycerol lipase n=1 Tax=Escovopsis weberi TaxID=150374 RepID=A0A0M8MQ29_ESCWE|nr:Mono- and diacylglycerol lipase [Escovopsis weberi]
MSSSLRLLSLIALAAASPFSSIESYSQTLHARDSTAAVTSSQLDAFRFYIQHASAAYCNFNTSAGDPVVCAGNACPSVNATIVDSFTGLLTGIGGYVSIDDSRQEIVLSVRGSNNVRNFIDDVVFLQVPCSLVSGCLLHVGFLQAWNEIEKAATLALATTLQSRPTYRIVATGHSLGAAVATVAAAYLRQGGMPMDIYTYGSPRVGNSRFVDFVTSQPGAENRITHTSDPVPRLPPMALNFRHTSPEYWLSTGDAETVDYSVDDIRICTGTANMSCNGGTIGLSVEAHEHYFQPTNGCLPSISL